MIYLIFHEINYLLFARISICYLILIEITGFSQGITSNTNVYIYYCLFYGYGIVSTFIYRYKLKWILLDFLTTVEEI